MSTSMYENEEHMHSYFYLHVTWQIIIFDLPGFVITVKIVCLFVNRYAINAERKFFKNQFFPSVILSPGNHGWHSDNKTMHSS